jgi:hypothetical protein
VAKVAGKVDSVECKEVEEPTPSEAWEVARVDSAETAAALVVATPVVETVATEAIANAKQA